ncbi:MAG: peptidase U32 family protein [Bacteroidota bacterium]|nr:peptidase U32 family protein [Bacteroidota bacterium]MDP4197128.1 peptidase U32 family protein [Bacteroidota bacterium]
MNRPELMAPAGDWTMLTAAVKSGANAVYFGVDKLNMRAKAKNFSIDDLPEIVKFCQEYSVKTYLTVNTIVFEEEIAELDIIIPKAKESGIDMIICWDMAVVSKCKEYDIPFCISTQASISNSASAAFFKSVGAKRVVLARECSLEEIKKIRANTDLELEAFIHGAMCIAVSGRCFMSHHLFGKSANRGECIQPCRRDYEVKEFEITDDQIDKSMVLGEDYVLSPKDLCSIGYIDKLIEAGINSFKIEGRKRSPEYVSKTVSVYRRAIDLYFAGKLTDKAKEEMLKELEEVYNRGFSSGFYFDTPSSDEYAGIYGSVATTKKEYIGKVINYFKKTNIAHIKLETGKITLNDRILIIGQSTGVVELKLTGMINNEHLVEEALKGDEVTFKCNDLIRPKDMVYKIVAVDK